MFQASDIKTLYHAIEVYDLPGHLAPEARQNAEHQMKITWIHALQDHCPPEQSESILKLAQKGKLLTRLTTHSTVDHLSDTHPVYRGGGDVCGAMLHNMLGRVGILTAFDARFSPDGYLLHNDPLLNRRVNHESAHVMQFEAGRLHERTEWRQARKMDSLNANVLQFALKQVAQYGMPLPEQALNHIRTTYQSRRQALLDDPLSQLSPSQLPATAEAFFQTYYSGQTLQEQLHSCVHSLHRAYQDFSPNPPANAQIAVSHAVKDLQENILLRITDFRAGYYDEGNPKATENSRDRESFAKFNDAEYVNLNGGKARHFFKQAEDIPQRPRNGLAGIFLPNMQRFHYEQILPHVKAHNAAQDVSAGQTFQNMINNFATPSPFPALQGHKAAGGGNQNLHPFLADRFGGHNIKGIVEQDGQLWIEVKSDFSRQNLIQACGMNPQDVQRVVTSDDRHYLLLNGRGANAVRSLASSSDPAQQAAQTVATAGQWMRNDTPDGKRISVAAHSAQDRKRIFGALKDLGIPDAMIGSRYSSSLGSDTVFVYGDPNVNKIEAAIRTYQQQPRQQPPSSSGIATIPVSYFTYAAQNMLQQQSGQSIGSSR